MEVLETVATPSKGYSGASQCLSHLRSAFISALGAPCSSYMALESWTRSTFHFPLSSFYHLRFLHHYERKRNRVVMPTTKSDVFTARFFSSPHLKTEDSAPFSPSNSPHGHLDIKQACPIMFDISMRQINAYLLPRTTTTYCTVLRESPLRADGSLAQTAICCSRLTGSVADRSASATTPHPTHINDRASSVGGSWSTYSLLLYLDQTQMICMQSNRLC
jgi:hypothetical protein